MDALEEVESLRREDEKKESGPPLPLLLGSEDPPEAFSIFAVVRFGSSAGFAMDRRVLRMLSEDEGRISKAEPGRDTGVERPVLGTGACLFCV